MILDSNNLKLLYDHAPCGYLLVHMNGEIVSANKTLLEWLDYEEETVIQGKNFRDLTDMGGKIYMETHVMPLLKMQESLSEVNISLVRRDASKIPVLLNAKLLPSEQEGRDTYLFIITDISQRKLYEQELITARKEAVEMSKRLKEVNEELESFAHSISHDLQAPLNTITFLVQSYQGRDTLFNNREEFDQFMDIVSDRLDQMRTMITDLLDYARIDTNSSNFEPVSIHDVCQEALDALHADIVKHDASIELNDLPVVHGDRSQLIRLFQNLFSNAIKYRSSRDPLIQVRSEKLRGFYTINVEDNGIGFKKEYEKKIFDFMVRLETDESVDGTGIGLASCKRIVEKHGGRIIATSEPGVGSTFSITLPDSPDHTD